MDKSFWHDRWSSGRIGFHRPDVHPFLVQFLPQLNLKSEDGVFVPLCGKSLDMLWLRDQGLHAIGVEISPIAVQAFFAENALDFSETKSEAFQIFESGRVSVYCGDIFDVTPEMTGECRAVYDRAALIAFPKSQREAYVRHLVKVLPPEAPILLVTLEYPQTQMDGPPFSVSRQEVERLFGARYRIDVLESVDALEESQNLRERGLQSLKETALLLSPR